MSYFMLLAIFSELEGLAGYTSKNIEEVANECFSKIRICPIASYYLDAFWQCGSANT